MNRDESGDGLCNGRKGEVLNDQGQDLCPIEGGSWTPFYYLANDGQGSQDRYFETWKSSMMGNGAREPAFFATLSTVNRDQINLFNAAAMPLLTRRTRARTYILIYPCWEKFLPLYQTGLRK